MNKILKEKKNTLKKLNDQRKEKGKKIKVKKKTKNEIFLKMLIQEVKK